MVLLGIKVLIIRVLHVYMYVFIKAFLWVTTWKLLNFQLLFAIQPFSKEK